jgi:single-stranded-DNA-specific exonuclease
MLGLERAVERIRLAARRGERVLLYGDYDTDGVASIVILHKMRELLGIHAEYHVPDRLKEGYGMQVATVEQAAAGGVTLIISVDTGIRALEAVAAGNRLGVDTIITDHHLPEAELPAALAVLDPSQPGCPYPNKALCGAGVTFKLIQGLMDREELPPNRIVRLSDSFLIMVAIATVADIVPLTGENRTIVKRGLTGLQSTRNPGLRALLASAGFAPGAALSATDVAFRVSPRINAAGRMRNARDVIDLFLTADEPEAARIAGGLDGLNSERRQTGDAIFQSIQQQLERSPELLARSGFVFSAPGWHRGVVGIVASRLVEEYHRPALILSEDAETGFAQGSGRSVGGFHLIEALDELAPLLDRYGGHKQAVGLSVPLPHLAEFSRRFDEVAAVRLAGADLCPTRLLDAQISMEEISDTAIDEVLSLAPFGLGNTQPQFLLRGVEFAEPPVVFKERHLRFRIASAGRTLSAKAWNFASRAPELLPGARFDLAVTFEEDAYSASRGYAPWSATVRDIRPAEQSIELVEAGSA